MKYEICQNGKVLYTIEATDNLSSLDIAVVSRNVLSKASATAEGFEDLFFTAYKDGISNKEAYFKAEDMHYSIFGQYKYSSYESFKNAKSRWGK